eukprot:1161265-Pelagomonas_calceolata.AAC.5
MAVACEVGRQAVLDCPKRTKPYRFGVCHWCGVQEESRCFWGTDRLHIHPDSGVQAQLLSQGKVKLIHPHPPLFNREWLQMDEFALHLLVKRPCLDSKGPLWPSLPLR